MRKCIMKMASGEVTRQKVPSAHSHWNLLMTLINASRDHLPTEEFSIASAIVAQRNVGEYLAASKRFLSDHTTYDQRSVNSIRCSRYIWSFLKKYPFGDDENTIDTGSVAIQKLASSEAQCHRTNRRLWVRDTSEESPTFVHKARKLIADVLGELTPALENIYANGRPGKGSVLGSVSGKVSPFYKVACLPYTVTPRAALYAYELMAGCPLWMDYLEACGLRNEVPTGGLSAGEKENAKQCSDFLMIQKSMAFVHNENVQLVPKDATTDRPIAVGASLNMILQLGVNAYMTERLSSIAHINLLDQGINQRMAYEGSLLATQIDPMSDLQYSTIDLASASDTISDAVVELLLPSDWYAFLSDLRHDSGVLPGGATVHYARFSAMGNGFTFPLESLIFWAVSYIATEETLDSVKRNDLSVYGDDIIVRAACVPRLLELLEYFGFTVNTEKSFVRGGFKESCGKDYWDGHDIRPLHLKRILDDAGLYYLANRIARLTVNDPGLSWLVPLYEQCVALLGSRRLLGPLTVSDGELGISEDYLAVPLETIKRRDSRPFLDSSEIGLLVSKKAFPSNPVAARKGGYVPLDGNLTCEGGIWKCNVPIAVYLTDVPLEYKGSNTAMYTVYQWLKGLGLDTHNHDKHSYYSERDLLWLDAGVAGKPTRRGKFKTVLRARPTSMWNSTLSRQLIRYHPAFWVDLS